MSSKPRFTFGTKNPSKRLLPALGSCCFLLAPLAPLSLYSPSAMMAQVSGGSLSGRVTDPSGASVAGARVTVTNRATNISKSLVTSGQELFNAPNIEPAVYDVLVDQPGFSQQHLTVTIEIARDSLLNVQLSVGAETQTVQVETTAASVDLGTHPSTRLSMERPCASFLSMAATLLRSPCLSRMYTRSITSFLSPRAIIPARIAASAPRSRLEARVHSRTITGLMDQHKRLLQCRTRRIARRQPGRGCRTGVLRRHLERHGGLRPQLGRLHLRGDRSGGNKFHGSAYEFIRNSALDARNYFSNNTAPFKRNQFGGTVGGPILKDLVRSSFSTTRGFARAAAPQPPIPCPLRRRVQACCAVRRRQAARSRMPPVSPGREAPWRLRVRWGCSNMQWRLKWCRSLRCFRCLINRPQQASTTQEAGFSIRPPWPRKTSTPGAWTTLFAQRFRPLHRPQRHLE